MRRNEQLEIRFEMPAKRYGALRRQRRQARARWWFDRMRRVVNDALDWGPAPMARPRQTDLSLASTR